MDSLKKYSPFVLFILVVLFAFGTFYFWSAFKQEKENNEFQQKLYSQNSSALIDSITKEFNKKLQAYEFSKDNYLVERLDDLEKYNKVLYDELRRVRGEVLAAIKTEVQGDLGGISASNDLVVLDKNSNYYGLRFRTEYSDPGFEQKLVGISKFYAIPNEQLKNWNLKPDETVFDTNLTTIRITYGFRELEDKYNVFAVSPSPKIELLDLTGGYFINKQVCPPVEPKKWAIGPYIGFGLNTDPNLSNPRFGWSMGFSIHYDIVQWGFGKNK